MKSSRRGFFGISLGGAAAVADGSVTKQAISTGKFSPHSPDTVQLVNTANGASIATKDYYKQQIESITNRLRVSPDFEVYIDENELAAGEINSLKSINSYTRLRMRNSRRSRIILQRKKIHLEVELRRCIDEYTKLGGIYDIIKGFLK